MVFWIALGALVLATNEQLLFAKLLTFLPVAAAHIHVPAFDHPTGLAGFASSYGASRSGTHPESPPKTTDMKTITPIPTLPGDATCAAVPRIPSILPACKRFASIAAGIVQVSSPNVLFSWIQPTKQQEKSSNEQPR